MSSTFFKRINFGLILSLILLFGCQSSYEQKLRELQSQKPNIILCMADDLGWGDPGFNGNQIIKTPQLDDMASEGLVFNRFYSSSPVCSPTRGSCLTGRHPYRYGIFGANTGHLPKDEITIAELLHSEGYRTGFFGKWHLGTLTIDIKDSNRGGPEGAEHFEPPSEHGFDRSFATEAKVPTFDPMLTPIGWQGNQDSNKEFGTYYWDEMGRRITHNLGGDDSRIIMDRVIPFIEESVLGQQPFFVVVWFHTPHLPVLADSNSREDYIGYTEEEQNYFGCITAMDEQIGRLRNSIKELGISENTMIWFTSDNGPEGPVQNEDRPGSTGPFKGRKRSLYEGGVRVPGILEWPALVKKGSITEFPASTLDYFPTIAELLGFEMDDSRPVDGISLLPMLINNEQSRGKNIAFESGDQLAFMNDQYKIYSSDGGSSFELFDLIHDGGEEQNIAFKYPERVNEMAEQLQNWRLSCKRSQRGEDY